MYMLAEGKLMTMMDQIFKILARYHVIEDIFDQTHNIKLINQYLSKSALKPILWNKNPLD